MAGDRSGALAAIDDAAVLQRISNGERVTLIAAELHVDPSALYHRYADRPEYQVAQEQGTAVRLEALEEEIDKAPDPFSLARARERGRVVLWRAEREHARWAAKQETKVEASLVVRVERIGNVIDGTHDVVVGPDVHAQQVSGIQAIIDRSSGEPE